MPRAARILVVGNSAQDAGETADVLRSRGFATCSATPSGALAELLAARRPNVVLFDSSGADGKGANPAMQFADKIRAADMWHDMPFIVLGGNADVPAGDATLLVDHLKDDVLPAELDHRIRSVARLATMRAELKRRAETLQALGMDVSFEVAPPAFIENPHILIIGAGRGALKVQNAWGEQATFTGVPSINLALDALAEHDIDAVAIDGTSDPAGAEDTLKALRKVTTWTSLPVIVILDDEERAGAFHDSGAGDVEWLSDSDERLVSRLHLLMREHRYSCAIQKVFRDNTVLPHDGSLVARDFMLHHLMRVILDCDRNGASASLIAAGAGTGDDNKAADAFSGALEKLVRGEDLAAKLSDRLFLIVMPDTVEDVARVAMNRLSNIVQTTNFGGSKAKKPPFRFALSSYRAGDDAETLLTRALDGIV